MRHLLRARRAVFALPQRLMAAHARFDLPLPALLADALAATPTLLSAALAFSNTSCALSNFPDEHQPYAALLRAIALESNVRLVHVCPDIDPAAVPA
ncbi:hypothetical protein [Paraburkholderia dilworthii]|uniref:hypothetical protein n=1 Tax=Paraburkholderia dilworthii TaxID=948106 RepID=UPI0004152C90|nr:hypothetical protein [Paraburkholderia dilworthii]